MLINTVKGTREFYPQQMAIRNYLQSKIKSVSELFGYQEYDGPFLESLELYAAKSGDELVNKQSFTFQDRGGNTVALRPELTPSLARMIAAKQNEITFPARWWSFGPFWRYEQPQKGRAREFFQWNIDSIGVESPEADAELIAIAAEFLRSVNLEPQKAKIYVNNRRLMESVFNEIGISGEKKARVSNMIDCRSKMETEKWDACLSEIGLTESQIKNLKGNLDDKNLWKKSEELARLFNALESLGVMEYVEFDANIVRGLLYYTGTVFEAFEKSGSLKRAILGGGRYDNLLADVGGQPLSGIGFAMGDIVIGIILQESKLLPEYAPNPAKVMITVFDEELIGESLKLSHSLRAEGIKTICYPEYTKIQKQFKFADKMGIDIVLTIGPDEMSNGTVSIKNMKDGKQEIKKREIVLRELLEIARS